MFHVLKCHSVTYAYNNSKNDREILIIFLESAHKKKRERFIFSYIIVYLLSMILIVQQPQLTCIFLYFVYSRCHGGFREGQRLLQQCRRGQQIEPAFSHFVRGQCRSAGDTDFIAKQAEAGGTAQDPRTGSHRGSIEEETVRSYFRGDNRGSRGDHIVEHAESLPTMDSYLLQKRIQDNRDFVNDDVDEYDFQHDVNDNYNNDDDDNDIGQRERRRQNERARRDDAEAARIIQETTTSYWS